MRRLLAVVLVGASVLGACDAADESLGRADAEPTTTASAGSGDVATSLGSDTTIATETTGTPPPTAATIDWQSCGSIECATITAPLDHDDPSAGTIELAVGRRRATGDRVGALFVNFGGPGASARDRLAGLSVPAAVSQRFDLIGVDPRGTGDSVPFECGIDPHELYALDPTFEDAADRQAFLDTSRRYVDDCATKEARLLPHLGSRDLARDLDVVRATVGDETLSYLGYSYGTVIGQAYADLFPGRTRSMILDGVVDPALSGLDAAVGQARGLELALGRWADGCGRRGSCGLDDPIGAVRTALAAAEDGIPAGGRTLGPGSASVGVAYPLYAASLWPSLDAAITDAVAGRGEALYDLADSYARLTDFAVYFGVNCLDSSWPADPDAVIDRARAAGDTVLGTAVVVDYLRCALWPVAPDPIGAVTAPGTPPILVVSTTGDPATPHENGVRVADRLASGHLLTHDGDGHLIVFRGSACIDRAAVAYLVDGTVPAAGAVC